MRFLQVPELPTLIEEEEEDLWDHISDFFSQGVKGFIKGFTTISVGDEDPVQGYEQLAYSIGNLFGFIGIIPGVGTAGSLITRGGATAAKGAIAATRFVSDAARGARRIQVAGRREQAGAAKGLFDRVLNIEKTAGQQYMKQADDLFVKQMEKANRVIDRRKEYYQFLKDDFGNYPTFRSVPFYVADVAERAVLSGLRRIDGVEKLTRAGTPGMDTIRQMFRIGTAFSVGSWQEGTNAMMSSFVMGAALGGFDKVLANTPGLKPRLRVREDGQVVGRFRDMSHLWTGTREQAEEASKMAARAMAGGILNTIISNQFGEPLEMQIYNFLLGAWFGGKEISSAQMRALQHIQQARRTHNGIHNIDRTPEFTGEGKDAYGRDVIPFDNETKAEIIRWKKQTYGNVGEALTVLSGAREGMRNDIWETFLKGGGIGEDLFSELVENRKLISIGGLEDVIKRVEELGRPMNEEDLYQAIAEDAAGKEPNSEVATAIANIIGMKPQDQMRVLRDAFAEKVRRQSAGNFALRGGDLLKMDERPMDPSLEKAAADMVDDAYGTLFESDISVGTLAKVVDQLARPAYPDGLLPTKMNEMVSAIGKQIETYREDVEAWATDRSGQIEGVREFTNKVIDEIYKDSDVEPGYKEKQQLFHYINDQAQKKRELTMAGQTPAGRKAYAIKKGQLHGVRRDGRERIIGELEGASEMRSVMLERQPGYVRPRVLVTGGRRWGQGQEKESDAVVRARIYNELKRLDPWEVVHGAAKGVDSLAGRWAEKHGVQVHAVPIKRGGANESIPFKARANARNQQMLTEYQPDIVVAFPGGAGTADQVARARKQGFTVVEVNYERARETKWMLDYMDPLNRPDVEVKDSQWKDDLAKRRAEAAKAEETLYKHIEHDEIMRGTGGRNYARETVRQLVDNARKKYDADRQANKFIDWLPENENKPLREVWLGLMSQRYPDYQSISPSDATWLAFKKAVELRTWSYDKREHSYRQWQKRREMGELSNADRVVNRIGLDYEQKNDGEEKMATTRESELERVVQRIQDKYSQPDTHSMARPIAKLKGVRTPRGLVTMEDLDETHFGYKKGKGGTTFLVARKMMELAHKDKMILMGMNNDVNYGHLVVDPWNGDARAHAQYIVDELYHIRDEWEGKYWFDDEGHMYLESEGALAWPLQLKDYGEAGYFARRYEEAMAFLRGKPMRVEVFDEVDRAHFAFSLAYTREVNGGMDMRTLFDGMATGNILSSDTQVNKRWKILSNGDYALDWLELGKIDISEEQKKRGTMRVVIVDDSDPAVDTDGVGRIRGDWLAEIRRQRGFDERVGFLKPFIAYTEGRGRAGEPLGALLGKMAWHAQTPEMSREMKRHGIDLILHKSAVKQTGFRTVHQMRVVNDRIVFDEGETMIVAPEIYEIPLRNITLGPKHDNPDKYGRPTRMGIQMISGLTVERDRDMITAMERMMQEEGSEWAGHEHDNKVARVLIEALKQGDNSWREMEEGLLDEFSWHRVGVPVKAEAMQLKVTHPSLFIDSFIRHLIDIEDAREFDEDALAQGRENEDFMPTDTEEDLLLRSQKKMQEQEAEGLLMRRSMRDMLMRATEQRGVVTLMDMHTPAMRGYFRKVFQRHASDALNKPKLKHSFKGILATSGDFEGHTADGFFRVTNGHRDTQVWYGDQKNVRLEAAYKDFMKHGGWDNDAADHAWRKRAMRMAVVRFPQPSMSGVRNLKFDGFTNIDGFGVQVSAKEMGYLGGADKDIDDVKVFQALPDAYMDGLLKYEDQWYDKEKGGIIAEKNKEFEPEIVEERQINFGRGEAFHTRSIIQAGINAKKGKDFLAIGLSQLKKVMTYIEEVVRPEYGNKTFGGTGKGINTGFGKDNEWYWTARLKPDVLHNQKDGLIAVTRQIVNFAADSSDYGKFMDKNKLQEFIWSKVVDPESVRYWRRFGGKKDEDVTQWVMDNIVAEQKFLKMPWKDPRFNQIGRLQSALQGRYKVRRMVERTNREGAKYTREVSETVEMDAANGRDYVAREIRRWFPRDRPGAQSMLFRVLKQLTEMPGAKGGWWVSKEASLPFKKHPSKAWVPAIGGPMVQRIHDRFDRVFGTGARARSRGDTTPIYSPDPNYADRQLAFMGRMRVATATEQVRDRDGMPRLMAREGKQEWESIQRDYEDQPEVQNARLEDYLSGKFFQDVADAASARTQVQEGRRVRNKLTDAEYEALYKKNVGDRGEDQGKPFSNEMKDMLVFKEVSRITQEMAVLTDIRRRLAAKGKYKDTSLLRTMIDYEPPKIYLYHDQFREQRQAVVESQYGKEWADTVKKILDEGETTRADLLNFFRGFVRERVKKRADAFARYRQVAFVSSLQAQGRDYDAHMYLARKAEREARKAWEQAKRDKADEDTLNDLYMEMRQARRNKVEANKEWHETSFNVWKMDEQYVSDSVVAEWTDAMNDVWMMYNYDVTESQIRGWMEGMRLDQLGTLLEPGAHEEARMRIPSQFLLTLDDTARAWARGNLSGRLEEPVLHMIDMELTAAAKKRKLYESFKPGEEPSAAKQEQLGRAIQEEVKAVMGEADALAQRGLGHHLIEEGKHSLGRRISFGVAGDAFEAPERRNVLRNIANIAGRDAFEEALAWREGLDDLKKGIEGFALTQQGFWRETFNALETARHRIMEQHKNRLPPEVHRAYLETEIMTYGRAKSIASEIMTAQRKTATEEHVQAIMDVLYRGGGPSGRAVTALLVTSREGRHGDRYDPDQMNIFLREAARKTGIPVYDVAVKEDRQKVETFLAQYRRMHEMDVFRSAMQVENNLDEYYTSTQRANMVAEELDLRYERLKENGMLGDKPIERYTSYELDDLMLGLVSDAQVSHPLFGELAHRKVELFYEEVKKKNELIKTAQTLYRAKKDKGAYIGYARQKAEELEQHIATLHEDRKTAQRMIREKRDLTSKMAEEYGETLKLQAEAGLVEARKMMSEIRERRARYAEEDRARELLDPEYREDMTRLREIVERNPEWGPVLNKMFMGHMTRLTRGVGGPSLEMATRQDVKSFIKYLQQIQDFKFTPEYQHYHNYMFPEDVSRFLQEKGDIDFVDNLSLVNMMGKGARRVWTIESLDVMGEARRAAIWSRTTGSIETQKIHSSWEREMGTIKKAALDAFRQEMKSPKEIEALIEGKIAKLKERNEIIKTSDKYNEEQKKKILAMNDKEIKRHEASKGRIKEPPRTKQGTIDKRKTKGWYMEVPIQHREINDYMALLFQRAHYVRLLAQHAQNIDAATTEFTHEHLDKVREVMAATEKMWKAEKKQLDDAWRKKGYEKKELVIRRKALKGKDMLQYVMRMENRIMKRYYDLDRNADQYLVWKGKKGEGVIDVDATLKKIERGALVNRQLPDIGPRAVKRIVSEMLLQEHIVELDDGQKMKFKDLTMEQQNRMRRELMTSRETRGKFSVGMRMFDKPGDMYRFFPMYGYSKNDMNDHMRWMYDTQDDLAETYGKDSRVLDMVASAADTIFNPDYNAVATDNLREAGLRFNPLYGNHVAQYVRPMFGFDMKDSAFPNWLESVAKGKNKQLAAMLGHRAVERYTARHERRLGKLPDRYAKEDAQRAPTEQDQVVNWAKMTRTYIQRVAGGISYTPQSVRFNPAFKQDKFYAVLTDKPWMDKAKDPVRRANDLAVIGEIAARYDLITLLAHPKVWVGNVFGGTLNNAINVGAKYTLSALPTPQNIAKLSAILPKVKGKNDRETWRNIIRWTQMHGVQDAMQTQDFGTPGSLGQSLRKDQFQLRREATGKYRPIDYAEYVLRSGSSERFVRSMASFIQHSEKQLRTISFLSHYMKFRDLFHKQGLRPGKDDPYLVELANKGVSLTQFLYDNVDRPFVAQTNLGKIFYRYKLWVGNSIRMFERVWREARLTGYAQGTEQMEQLNRYMLGVMFTGALAQALPYSIFSSAVPAPMDQFVELAEMVFGDEDDKDDSFYGYGRFGIGGGLWSQIRPSVARPLDAVFYSMLTGEYEQLADYHMWTWLPMGRMLRTAKQVIEGDQSLLEGTTGLPDEFFGDMFDVGVKQGAAIFNRAAEAAP